MQGGRRALRDPLRDKLCDHFPAGLATDEMAPTGENAQIDCARGGAVGCCILTDKIRRDNRVLPSSDEEKWDMRFLKIHLPG